eukprot:GSMAST32.ASY1.ANO1.115.1 assembled CDS
MLSGETAKGLYPIESLKMMHSVAIEAEVAVDYSSTLKEMRGVNKKTGLLTVSAVVAARKLDAAAVLVFSEGGTTVQAVAKYRPSCPIIVASSNERTLNACNLYRGIIPVLLEEDDVTAGALHSSIEAIEDMGLRKDSQPIVAIQRSFVANDDGTSRGVRTLAFL